MHSDQHDPKNHVPPVHPGDDWGDLDHGNEMPHVALPPKRRDRGIPTKRDVKTVTKQDTRKQFRDRFEKIMDQAPEKGSEETESEASYEPEEELDAHESETSQPITVAPQARRHRVYEITPRRPTDKRVPKTPLIINKMAGKRASNEVRMKNGVARRSKEFSSGARNARQTLAWMAGAGALIIAIIIGAIFLSRPAKKGTETGKLSVFNDVISEEFDQGGEVKDGGLLDTLINGEKQAKVTFATYETAKSVDDFMEMVYLPKKNRAVISKNWDPTGVDPDWKPGENCVWTVTEKGSVKFAVLSAVRADYSNANAVFRQEGDRLKMDWRATTGYCSADYSELKEGHGDGAEIRAILSPGDFHTFSLPEGEFRCYRLTAPDKQENVWAYTKLDSANDEKLRAQFLPSQLTGNAVTEIPALLMLERGNAQSLPNQWMITKVIRFSWLDE